MKVPPSPVRALALALAPGEVGEVVITTLDKQASPLLRWRTHDLVRRADRPYACACGRHAFPLIGRIIGRSDTTCSRCAG